MLEGQKRRGRFQKTKTLSLTRVSQPLEEIEAEAKMRPTEVGQTQQYPHRLGQSLILHET